MPHTDAWKKRQAEVARGLNDTQRRGLNLVTTRTRTVVVTFDTTEAAEAWDLLEEVEAFGQLWAAAAARAADEARRKGP